MRDSHHCILNSESLRRESSAKPFSTIFLVILVMSEASTPRHEIPSIFQLSRAKPDRLIHLLPNELKREVPNHILFSYPKTTSPRDGFIDVSAAAFADAVDRTAWYLRNTLGEPTNFETVAYIGSSKCCTKCNRLLCAPN
jgi:hypothetical protein